MPGLALTLAYHLESVRGWGKTELNCSLTNEYARVEKKVQ